MTRDNENSQERGAQNEHHRGWEHVPSRDNDETVSLDSYLSPTSTVDDSSQFRQNAQHDRCISGHLSDMPKKEAESRHEEVFDAEPQLKRRRFLGEWWQEMLSAISSVFCLVAIIVILYKVNGKPLSYWDGPVSLNAIVSVLSTAGKAGLILPVAECISQLKWVYLQGSSKSHLEQLQTFDSASRGPAGSLQFFLRAKGAPPISYLACLIVILALALDPFAQQIIQYRPSFYSLVPGLNSTVRHSQVYDRGEWYGANYGYYQGDDAVLSGMLSGLYGNLPHPPFSCPGLNCTYPEVTSLGICSTCEDVTERTVTDCEFAKDFPSYTGSLMAECNYTLPGGSNFTAFAFKEPTNFGFNYPSLEMSVADGDVLREDGTGTIKREVELFSMNFIHFDRFEANSGTQSLHDGYEWVDTMSAHECVFETCAWAFTNWSHLDGALQEGSVAQSKLQPSETLPRRGGRIFLEVSDPDFPGNHSFEINRGEQDIMTDMFMIIWNTWNDSIIAADQFRNSLYLADPDVPRTLDAMTRGITYNMMDGPNSTTSKGQVFKTETFIIVRWEWLILSIFTVAGSVALLAATIVKTCIM